MSNKTDAEKAKTDAVEKELSGDIAAAAAAVKAAIAASKTPSQGDK